MVEEQKKKKTVIDKNIEKLKSELKQDSPKKIERSSGVLERKK